MSAQSSIEWTDRTWNPVRGCSVISPGCVNCYAMKQAHRFSGAGKPYEGLTKQTKAGPQWTGVVRTVEDALIEPLSWRKPSRVFVNSMSDLFHEGVPVAFIDEVFDVMARTPRHTYQILTKRADRMLAYMREGVERPLPNVWLGVSVEDQQHADERIPQLLQTPAAVRFISAEPLLGPVNLHVQYLTAGESWPALDWVIVGGESGRGARPCAEEWIQRVVQQCQSASVPVFVKQLGAYVVSEYRTAPAEMMSDPEGARRDFSAPNGEVWACRAGFRDRKGADPDEWPAELRVREFPTT
jgi:protein gp37